MFGGLFSSLLTIVYPRECRVCKNSVENHSAGVACADCWIATRIFSGEEVLCNKCGAFLSETGGPVESYCGDCGDHFYDKAVGAGIYEKALAASIINLKKFPFISSDLRNRFIAAFQASRFQDSTTLIVPVPLSKRRRFERGFNQAEILGAVIADQSGIPMDKLSLCRKIHTPMHRAAMDKKARDLTVRNAFEIGRPKLI